MCGRWRGLSQQLHNRSGSVGRWEKGKGVFSTVYPQRGGASASSSFGAVSIVRGRTGLSLSLPPPLRLCNKPLWKPLSFGIIRGGFPFAPILLSHLRLCSRRKNLAFPPLFNGQEEEENPRSVFCALSYSFAPLFIGRRGRKGKEGKSVLPPPPSLLPPAGGGATGINKLLCRRVFGTRSAQSGARKKVGKSPPLLPPPPPPSYPGAGFCGPSPFLFLFFTTPPFPLIALFLHRQQRLFAFPSFFFSETREWKKKRRRCQIMGRRYCFLSLSAPLAAILGQKFHKLPF